jgi:hypothetical protein
VGSVPISRRGLAGLAEDDVALEGALVLQAHEPEEVLGAEDDVRELGEAADLGLERVGGEVDLPDVAVGVLAEPEGSAFGGEDVDQSAAAALFREVEEAVRVLAVEVVRVIVLTPPQSTASPLRPAASGNSVPRMTAPSGRPPRGRGRCRREMRMARAFPD